MIIGKKVILDSIEEADLELLREWRNREHYNKFFREYKQISKTMQKKWFEEKVNNDNSTIMFAIRDINTRALLGCCGLCYINWVNRHADLSLYIGWDDSYIDEVGYAKESCFLLFDYGFKKLNLNKIWTEIYEFDTKKNNLYTQIGMKVDGKLRDQYYYNGQYYDSIMMSILDNEFIY